MIKHKTPKIIQYLLLHRLFTYSTSQFCSVAAGVPVVEIVFEKCSFSVRLNKTVYFKFARYTGISPTL